ncbi:sugar O-acetyltransferase [Vibrio astriarenae]|uniref:sugar O-acetyltransferase n=1 Tax=Vibrio astriarenae TaxID=1481923 RepID=UPI0037356EA0
MTFLEQSTSDERIIHRFDRANLNYKDNAKDLCFELNQTHSGDLAAKERIYKQLFGTVTDFINVEAGFRCDYGFNIHFLGRALVNFNSVILDTSPVTIGHGVMIGPGCVLSCAGHAIDPEQRVDGGLYDSAPITVEDRVWIGANTTVCAGVTIGNGSVIGAGSVVTKDIPAGVIAYGNPCRVVREITEDDKWEFPLEG